MQPRFTRHKNIHSRKCIVQKSLRSIEKLYPRTADKDIPRIRYKANWSRENMIVSYKQPLYIDLTFAVKKKNLCLAFFCCHINYSMQPNAHQYLRKQMAWWQNESKIMAKEAMFLQTLARSHTRDIKSKAPRLETKIRCHVTCQFETLIMNMDTTWILIT